VTTDLVVRSPTVPAQEWFLISAQADELSKSDIIPSAYRRKPANIVVAALTGRHWGWDVLTAMRNGHVIEGTWAMKPEAMVGLVRQAGHSLTAEVSDDKATVTGTRADNGDTFTYTFTVADAEQAGLCKIVDGKPKARSSSGKALPWEQYPKVMCYWRAAAMVCRLLFGDITAGVHSAEELAMVGADGEIIEAEIASPTREREPEPLSEENLDRFRRACESEGLEPERVLDEAFGEGVRPDPLTDADLPAMRDAFSRLSQAAQSPAESAGGAPPASPAGAEDEGDPTLPGIRGLPATRAQVGKIKGEYNRLGIEDRLLQLSHSSELLGGIPLKSHNDLNRGQAHQLIELLVMAETLG